MITLILGPNKSGKKYIAKALGEKRKRNVIVDLRDYLAFPALEFKSDTAEEHLSAVISKQRTEIIILAPPISVDPFDDGHKLLALLTKYNKIDRVMYLYKVGG